MNTNEFRSHIKQVRRQFGRLRIDGLLVIGPENVRYLTGFTGHDSWALVLPRQVVLITDSRYTEQAQGECVNCRIVERKGPPAKEVQRIVSKLKGITTLAVEDSCSVAMLKVIRKSLSARIKPV
ncbi:MAG: Xaa-Pro dipeptidase, partial [Planctomycetota bacterium]